MIGNRDLQIDAMAAQLFDRVSNLVDGYKHLDEISSVIPLTKHTPTNISKLFEPEDKAALQSQLTQLESLKKEVSSLSHERVVVEVLTRNSIGSHRVTRNNTSRLIKPKLTAQPPAPRVTTSMKDEYISLPSYSSRSNTSTPNPTTSSKHSKPIIYPSARAVGGMRVPSMRQGSLPEELRQLKSTPTIAVTGPPPTSTNISIKKRHEAAKASRQQQERLQKSEQELSALRVQLESEAKKNVRNRAEAEKRMASLAQTMQEQHARLEQQLNTVVQHAVNENDKINVSNPSESRTKDTAATCQSPSYRVVPVGKSTFANKSTPIRQDSPRFDPVEIANQVVAMTKTVICNYPQATEDSNAPESHSDAANVVVSAKNERGRIISGCPASFQLVDNGCGVHWEQRDISSEDASWPAVRPHDVMFPNAGRMTNPNSMFAGQAGVPDSLHGHGPTCFEHGDVIVVHASSSDPSPSQSLDENMIDMLVVNKYEPILGQPGNLLSDTVLNPLLLEYGANVDARRPAPAIGPFPNRHFPFVSRILEDAKEPAVNNIDVPVDSERVASEIVESANDLPVPVSTNTSAASADKNSLDELLQWLPMVMLGQQETIRNNQELIMAMLQRQNASVEKEVKEAVAVPPSGPTAAEIAVAVASAVEALAAAQRQNDIVPCPPIQAATPPISDFSGEIVAAVNAGVVSGVRDALSFMGAPIIPSHVAQPSSSNQTRELPRKQPVIAPSNDTHIYSKKPTGLLHVRGVGTGHATAKRGTTLEDVVSRDMLTSRNCIASMKDADETNSVSVESGEYSVDAFTVGLSCNHSSGKSKVIRQDIGASTDSDLSEHWYGATAKAAIGSNSDDESQKHETRRSYGPAASGQLQKKGTRTFSCSNNVLPRPLVSMVADNAATVGIMNLSESALLASNDDFSMPYSCDPARIRLPQQGSAFRTHPPDHLREVYSPKIQHQFRGQHRNVLEDGEYECEHYYDNPSDSDGDRRPSEQVDQISDEDWSSVGRSVDLGSSCDNSDILQIPSAGYREPSVRLPSLRQEHHRFLSAMSSTESNQSASQSQHSSSIESEVRRPSAKPFRTHPHNLVGAISSSCSSRSHSSIDRDIGAIGDDCSVDTNGNSVNESDDHGNGVGDSATSLGSISSDDCAIPLDDCANPNNQPAMRFWRPSQNNLAGQWGK